ncbi:MAG: hypothetical protein GY733_01625, partial [bacterium]|nr:hypothetical protein [bacterium]
MLLERGRTTNAIAGAIGLTLLLGGFFLYIRANADVRFDTVSYPAISASTDPDAAERGAYLVHAVAHCSFCHAAEGTPLTDRASLSGGRHIPTPLAHSHSSNLTSDALTGIQDQSDAQLARTIRHAVRADGSLATLMKIGVGPMADPDLADVIAYLRSQPAVRHQVTASSTRLAGDALLALGLMGPMNREAPPYAPSGPNPSIERGRY